jgi:hypothetical protein
VAISILKPPNGGFGSETAVACIMHGGFGSETEKTFNGYIFNGHPLTEKFPFGCNGHVTAVAVGLLIYIILDRDTIE